MRFRSPLDLLAIWLGFWLSAGPQATAPAPWPCPAKPVAACVKQHGRLSSQNGTALKIWLIGTTRVLGIENDVDRLPPAIQKYLDMTSPDHSHIFGDFEICPTEPDKPDHMRRACLAGAEKLVVQDVRGLKPPFRIRSTWAAAGREP